MNESALSINLLSGTVHGDDAFPLLGIVRLPQTDVAVVAGRGEHCAKDVPRNSPHVVVMLAEFTYQPETTRINNHCNGCSEDPEREASSVEKTV